MDLPSSFSFCPSFGVESTGMLNACYDVSDFDVGTVTAPCNIRNLSLEASR